MAVAHPQGNRAVLFPWDPSDFAVEEHHGVYVSL